MECPHCSSTHTRTFRILSEEGTSTSGEYQSKLARRCSPPILDDEIATLYLWVAAIVSTVAAYKVGRFADSWGWGVGIFAATFIAFIVLWTNTISRKRHKEYQLHLREWEKSWVCMTCGEDFVIS